MSFLNYKKIKNAVLGYFIGGKKFFGDNYEDI